MRRSAGSSSSCSRWSSRTAGSRPADKPSWSLREFAATFYVDPRKSPDFAWAFVSRFLFVLAYAFLATYQAYYLLNKLGSAEADVPQQIFLGTLVQSVLVVLASLVGGRLSDRTGRRKVFVLVASIVYGFALFVLAAATDVNGFLVGMAVSGLGFGVYVAVDLALVTQVLPDEDTVAKDLGVFNIAGALPFTIAPAIAPAVLAVGGGSYGVLYTVAGFCAVLGAFAILPVQAGQVRHRQLGGPSAWMGRPAAGESASTSGHGDRRQGSSRTARRGRRAPRAGSP